MTKGLSRLGRNQEDFGRNVDLVNANLQGLSITNLSGQMLEGLTFSNNKELGIPHSLGIVPRYRLLLRQDKDGVIIEGGTAWTDKTVFLRLVSAPEYPVTVTIFLLRG